MSTKKVKSWLRLIAEWVAIIGTIVGVINNKLESDAKRELLWRQSNANQYNAETAMKAVGLPATRPVWNAEK